MRQAATAQLGARGEAAVEWQFTKLGWGAIGSARHDLGTDLFLLARDDRGYDLGLPVGAQVKTGSSFFTEPKYDEAGAAVGWWFRDSDREHVDYWLGYAIPHLIILHDDSTGTSYWAHVTDTSVVPTGKGAKILVPSENTISLECRDALLRVAASKRPAASWEGSVWADVGRIPPKNRLRYALLAPRLIAPHRTTASSAVSAEEAIALVVEARADDIERGTANGVGTRMLEAAKESPDWSWRFAGAIDTRVNTGQLEQLLACVADAEEPHNTAAAAVVGAAALMEKAQPEAARKLLVAALAREDLSPVDHAWLLMQRARADLDLGQIDDARSAAMEVVQVRPAAGDDITATAIAGVAAVLLYMTAQRGAQEIQAAVAGTDTTAAWWRTERAASGATAVVEREFIAWSRHRAVVLWAEDVANNRLFTASLLASHLGDHDTWRRHSAINAQQALLQVNRSTESPRVLSLLNDLLLSGDDKGFDKAVRRLVLDGPAEAVSTAAANIDFTNWTRTSAATKLTLLRRAGDVLDAETATAAVSWLLATLAEPLDFEKRTVASYDVPTCLADTLADVIEAAPLASQLEVVERVLSLPPQQDELAARSWARVVRALPDPVWTVDFAARAEQVSGDHHDVLRLRLLGAAALRHDTATHTLLNEICGHSLDALGALGHTRGLTDDAIAELITRLRPHIAHLIDEARHGMHHAWAHDVSWVITKLNIERPHLAQWDPVFALLEEPLVAGKDKRGTCILLALHANTLPDEVRIRLSAIAQAMLQHPVPGIDRMLGSRGARGPAALLVAMLADDTEQIHQLLMNRLGGGPDDRAWAARMAPRLAYDAAVGILTVLVHDPEPTVRSAAAVSAAQLSVDAPDDAPTATLLQHCLHDPGVLVPQALASCPYTPRAILGELTTHRSASARTAAERRLRHM